MTGSTSMHVLNQSCIELFIANIMQDGDNKLVICDLTQKLKVYKGTSLIVEHALLDKPVSQCVTYTDYAMPRVPSISVAAGSNIFIYRHIRPYRKWSCPNLDISEVETRVSCEKTVALHFTFKSFADLSLTSRNQTWEVLRSGSLSPSEGASQLCEARDTGTKLSALSLDYIMLEVSEWVMSYQHHTCMSTCLNVATLLHAE